MKDEALKMALEALLDIPFDSRNPMQKEAITAIKQALAAEPAVQEPVAKSFMVHLYNFGYKAGHHDTVEGRYIDICRQDMETYHLEDVSEWLQDMVYTTAAQPAPVQPVWIQPDHLQKAQKAPFLCRVEPHKRDDFVPLHTTPPAPAVPDALNPKDENPAYAAGWNDCRAEMLKGMK
jgi:hypothetical protein